MPPPSQTARRVFVLLLLLLPMLSRASPSSSGQVAGAPPSAPPWLDASQPVDARVAALLSAMTNEEKAAQAIHMTDCSNVTLILSLYGSTGLGACPLYGGDAGSLAQRNALQRALMAGSRLHLPATFHTESLHGGCGGCVIFPMPAGQAATWDAALVREIAAAVAGEAAVSGIDRGFSPELNVPTDARFGRTEESFSEDPMLTGALGAAAVLGLHAGEAGGPSSYLPAGAIVSEAKHAAAYAAGGKDGMAADVSERTLHDVYLRPWLEYAEAGGRGAMLAHNSISAVPCHASAELMGWLRAQGSMAGALLASDDCDVGLLAAHGFRVAADLQGAAALAMGAGLDQELCMAGDGRGQAFPTVAAAVAGGRLAQAALDRAAGNVLRAKFAAGLFDSRAIVNFTAGAINTPANRALARRAAGEGAVLLRNEGDLLPLALSAAAPTTVAIIGALAGCADNGTDCLATRSQCGGYTLWGAEVVSVLAAAYNESGVRVRYAPGVADVGGNSTAGFAAALDAAAASDVVLFVGGDSGGMGWNKNTCGEDDDRAELDLPGVQADLLAALGRSGKPVIAVLIHGRPVTFKPGLLDGVRALIAAWRPGCEGGHALWDVLTGRTPPSGRLAQAWVRAVGQVKSQASPWYSLLQGDFDQVDYNGDVISRGYADASSSNTPAFAFGAGLSYTSWALSLLSAEVDAAAGTLTVLARVQNTGAVASRQVVGAYYSRPLSAIVRAHKRLLAFGKTALLAPGEAETLNMTVPLRNLGSYDPTARAQLVEKGDYTIVIGADSVAESGSATITV